jgi:hypothetical protein
VSSILGIISTSEVQALSWGLQQRGLSTILGIILVLAKCMHCPWALQQNVECTIFGIIFLLSFVFPGNLLFSHIEFSYGFEILQGVLSHKKYMI